MKGSIHIRSWANIITIVFLWTALLHSCVDHGTESMPQNPSTPELPVLIVEPDSGKVGSIVTIHGTGFFHRQLDWWIQFPGADGRVLTEHRTDTSAATIVPFGTRSGPLLLCGDYSAGGPVALTTQFHPTEPLDTNALVVQPYNITPPVTANDSMLTGAFGYHYSWHANISGDTIHFSRGYSDAHQYYEYHVILCDHGPGRLPQLLGVWVFYRTDYPPTRTDTIRAGILKLQEYDPSSLIAGKFFGKPSTFKVLNGTFTFWVNIKR